MDRSLLHFATSATIALLLGACSSTPQTSTTSVSSEISSTLNLVQFHNTAFAYSLWHHSDCKVVKMESSDNDVTEAGDVDICGLTLYPEPADIFQEESPQIAAKMRLPLADFAKLTWEENRFDKNPNMKING